jgi:hypothetical protein
MGRHRDPTFASKSRAPFELLETRVPFERVEPQRNYRNGAAPKNARLLPF